ncbi:MAG TPA: protein-L-isoaspartate O-methyltransferase [Blastocatellia bacterium]|nr:protein-L-isoaspartate O-methyltransferase [Blastocatellia bacterium]
MDYFAARHTMVQNQIRTNRVTDPKIIAAMSELPRERFAPDWARGIAYVDEDIPLNGGRYLIEPLTSALLLQAAEINADDVVLDVGCGTGYISAISARIASAVVALESDAELAARAVATLAELGIETATIVVGPLREGWPAQAPYDVIVFGGAVSAIPAKIVEQLAQGGRMVVVITEDKGLGCGTLLLRQGGTVSRRAIFEAAIPVLPEFALEPTFRF